MKAALGAAGAIAGVVILNRAGAAIADNEIFGILAAGTGVMLGGTGLTMWRARYTQGSGAPKPRRHPSTYRIPRGAAHLPPSGRKPDGWIGEWPIPRTTQHLYPPGSNDAHQAWINDSRRASGLPTGPNPGWTPPDLKETP